MGAGHIFTSSHHPTNQTMSNKSAIQPRYLHLMKNVRTTMVIPGRFWRSRGKTRQLLKHAATMARRNAFLDLQETVAKQGVVNARIAITRSMGMPQNPLLRPIDVQHYMDAHNDAVQTQIRIFNQD